jgi:adenylate cyclase
LRGDCHGTWVLLLEAGSAILRGWALAAAGDVAAGIAGMRQGLSDWRATGSITYRTYFLGILADALMRRGDVAESLVLLDEALALARRTGEGFYEAELYRLHGEALLAGTPEPAEATCREAEEPFRQAFNVAGKQNAKSLQLRAAVSLARLTLRQDGALTSASRTPDTYTWFTQGLDTPDLVAARELLRR